MASLSGIRERPPALEVPEGPFRLTSPAFESADELPQRCAAVSPPLAWTAPPVGTRTLAVTGELCERRLSADDEAGILPACTVWVGWGIAAAAGGLRAGQEPCFVGVRYTGCSAQEDERVLLFSLLALDCVPPLLAGTRRRAFDWAVSGHVLGIALLVARCPGSRRWPLRRAGR
jgi:hypothetical protein